MTSVIPYVVALVIVAGAAALAAWAARGARGLRRLERRRILVTLKTGAWFEGVATVDGDVVVLRQVVTGPETGVGEPLEVDGEILVLRGDVDYVQTVTTTTTPAGGARAPQ